MSLQVIPYGSSYKMGGSIALCMLGGFPFPFLLKSLEAFSLQPMYNETHAGSIKLVAYCFFLVNCSICATIHLGAYIL